VTPSESDPILAKREHIRTLSNKAQRIGYLLYLFATIGFFVGLATTFSGPIVTAIIALLIIGSIVLAVAIQVGYAIRGAERHEEDSIAQRRRR
jgi:multisubunit Na+/H+ antiporter MnhG subunit